ncbi:MAG: signal peptidase II [Actinobacteria bacterium]|nr:signal peptidase II [Actinomycetota bacterium]MBL7060486.1 signal peptidase II [Actinomycetota bacterium]
MDLKKSKFIMNFLFVLSSIIIIVIDQVTKYMVNTKIPLNSSVEIIPNIIFISHIKNSGAAFGIFQNRTNVFIVISIIAIILIIILKIKLNLDSIFYNISLGFILGGAIGNLIDRIVFREVIDFIHLRYFAVFNVADSFICIGFGIVIILILKNYFKRGANKKN